MLSQSDLQNNYILFIKTLTGRTMTVTVDAETTIAGLVSQVVAKENKLRKKSERMMPSDIRLVFAGNLLPPEGLVAFYEFHKHGAIHCIESNPFKNADSNLFLKEGSTYSNFSAKFQMALSIVDRVARGKSSLISLSEQHDLSQELGLLTTKIKEEGLVIENKTSIINSATTLIELLKENVLLKETLRNDLLALRVPLLLCTDIGSLQVLIFQYLLPLDYTERDLIDFLREPEAQQPSVPSPRRRISDVRQTLFPSSSLAAESKDTEVAGAIKEEQSRCCIS